MALDLVPLDELVNELFNRADSIVIIARKELNDKEYHFISRYKGNPYKCVGLCQKMSHTLLCDIEEHEEPIRREEL